MSGDSLGTVFLYIIFRQLFDLMAKRTTEGVRFELTVGYNPTTIFKTVALNHSATPPGEVLFILSNSKSKNKLTHYRSLRRAIPEIGSSSRAAFTPSISIMIASRTRNVSAFSLMQPALTLSRFA